MNIQYFIRSYEESLTNIIIIWFATRLNIKINKKGMYGKPGCLSQKSCFP